MQYKKIVVTEKSILRNKEFDRREELLKELSSLLLNQEFVKGNFYEELVKRENEFPTGLNMGSFGVAIPHTDPGVVIKDSIAVAVLENPVQFGEMTNPENKVNAKVVFLLALTDSTKHLKVLQKIIKIIQDSNLLKSLFIKDEYEMSNFLNSYLNAI
ncbi:PTS sugar transporter subunit IIA [Clostridium sp. C8]|uniref:PTS sugar transporter subunit IIA n=1 Tax=Clostridium sp. C8 TaxID=1667357 RepID=UPI00062E4896|nr:PTS sugar transporter subunit IIA [Clostridium sp. C8]KLE15680.1 hypothetical protein AAT22_10195 [Clostridium sp. C8]